MKKYMRQNDTKPFLQVQIYDATDNPVNSAVVDLTGAAVRFIMRGADGTAKVTATLAGTEFIDRPNGIVRYEWETGDTDTCGEYCVEFEVTDSTAYISTYWDVRTAQEIATEQPPEPLVIAIVDDLG